MLKTRIEWCDSTWNPVTGCKRGCPYCYARRIAERFGGKEAEDGTLHDLNQRMIRVWTDDETGEKHDGKALPYPFGFDPTMHRYRLTQPQHWVKPQTIFVCSMADLFAPWVPDTWIEAVFAACDEAPRHRYIFLTKYPERYYDLRKAGKLPQRENWWYGSTIDSMKSRRYEGRLWDNTFLSIEPLTERLEVGLGSFGSDRWIILGAETGPRKEKVTPEKEWVDTICKAADITHAAVFMKDSLLPIMGEAGMRREFPWEAAKC